MVGLDKAKDSIFKESEEPEGIHIKGYDFSKGLDMKAFLKSYASTGFQASHLWKAIEIAKKMREEKVTIFLGYTSNMISSGVRESILHLVKNRMVHALVTTAGGVEEDIIKTLKPFLLGDFRLDGAELRRRGINRIGNILVPNDRYIEFEKIFTPLLKQLYQEQKQTGKIATPSEICRRLGALSDETSVLYWAAKNDIPVFCPGITDGSMGDMIFFFKTEDPAFKIDVSDDIVKLTDMVLDAKETGAIILGGSLPKHHIMNANMMREGTKYTIYINTAMEGDGSDSGALPEEAKSWGKSGAKAEAVKVQGDATIVFPLLVAGAFSDRL
ncbi:MAG: deoxyhypusine synthase [Candidatus Aenigmarchaeota archaeon]|nr:deoxyhypusine synthase [Candidatus Aenigmarchaeota archaeon]